MYLFCPKCQSPFPAVGHCPRCLSGLQSPFEAAESVAKTSTRPPSLNRNGFGGRFVIGCVIAVGLHIALREWTAAVLSLSSAGQIDFVIEYALRFLAVLPGGLLAGSGRPQAFPSGMAVGLVMAAAWLVFDPYPAFQIDLHRAGLAVLLALASGVAAFVGGRIWPATTELKVPESPRNSSLMELTTPPKPRDRSRPTHWARILACSTLIVVAVIEADEIRGWLCKLPKGIFKVTGPAAARTDFLITAVAVIMSGIIAGASSGKGFWHGILTALLSTTVVVPLQSSRPGEFPGIEWYLEWTSGLAFGGWPEVSVGALLFIVIGLSGWLGGQLFLPLSPKGCWRDA